MVARNPVAQLKKERERKHKDAEKEARLAALSEREIAKRQKAKGVRDQIRANRLEREQTEVRERQAAYRQARENEIERSRLAQEEVKRLAACVLVERQAQDANNSAVTHKPKIRTKRVRDETEASPSSVIRPVSPSLVGPLAPKLDELLKDDAYGVVPMPMPDEETVTSLATMRVIYADSKHGMGLWGEKAGRWARPHGWWPVIEALNKAFTYYGQTDKNIVMGEYNAVFVDCVESYCDWLPELFDSDGSALSMSDLVFRITRPDVEHDGTKGAPCRHRYKTLREQAEELYYSIHGAANGYAIPCVAAMIFAGPKVRRNGKTLQLYGSLYVLKKAPVTLNNVLEDHAKHIARSKGLPIGSQEVATLLVKGARKVAVRVLPVLVKQARLGGLYFDCKPSNTLFVEGATVYLSDFDAAMYSIMRTDDSCWESHLLVSLLLMGTHVRCYQPKGIGEGWAIAMRPLMLDLAVSARKARWLFSARIVERSFVPSRVNTPEEAKVRLEMMTYAYFCDPSRVHHFKVNPRFAKGDASKSLVNQMLKFVLTGSPVSRDVSVCVALGEVVEG